MGNAEGMATARWLHLEPSSTLLPTPELCGLGHVLYHSVSLVSIFLKSGDNGNLNGPIQINDT